MLAYLLQRVIATIPVLLGVSLLTFSMLHLVPGDPVALVMSTEDAWSKADVERVRDEFGLNDPLYVQYGRYVLHAVQGDFGISIRSRREVSSLILQVLPYTLELALCSMLVALVVGVPLGVIAAVRHNTWIDTLAAVLSLGAVSMPSFWLALLLIFLFSVAAIWWGPLRRWLWSIAFAALAVLGIHPQPASADYDKQDFTEAYTILPNESAF